ncbi:MAG: LysR family transcriptional regulator [Bdellovibrionaceae bacterium]|nr:LysR family transcriptional regulator [Pseudobdellovibrionaceae bacterium]
MDLQLIRIFVKVVQSSSFTLAAAQLKIPKSTVSKAVSRLEDTARTKLLIRTTRSLRLTPAGQAFFERCQGPIQTLEEAHKTLEGQDQALAGHLRVTAPEDLGAHVLAPAFGALTRRHSLLTFEMVMTDDVVDLVKDGFDLAVRIGALRESRLRAKKVGEVHLIAVATPGYLKAVPAPRRPQDLAQHDVLTLNNRRLRHQWAMKSKKETVTVTVQPRITCNDTSSLLRGALAGAGIALVPHYLCEEDLSKGRLVRVLPEWSTPGMAVHLLSPLAFSSSARLRTVSEHVALALSEALRWES